MSANSFESAVQGIRETLNEAWDLTKNARIHTRLESVSDSLDTLSRLYEESLEVRHAEEMEEQAVFEFRHGQLVGLAEEFGPLSRSRPESVCRGFKARQVNLVLEPLKAMMEADMGVPLSLASEAEEQTYSDVSLLLRGYLAVSASYALKYFDLKYDSRGQEVPDRRYGYGRR